MPNTNEANAVTPPLVSVIIPTYNNGRFIRQAVDSVLEQDFTDVEIIVIDDGSTDDTADVLQPYRDRIQYHVQENQGVCAARNRGLALARGRYVSFLDADDYFLPGKLTDQVAAYRRMPSLGILNSGWRLVDETGATIKDVEPWHSVPDLSLEDWLRWKPVFPGAMMFRREDLLRVGGFKAGLRQAEDVDLVLRLSLLGCEAVWIHRPTVCYRIHGRNTVRDSLGQAQCLTRVLDDFFAEPSVPAPIRQMEERIRFYSNIWLVWQLFSAGRMEPLAEYLRLAMARSFYQPSPVYVALHCLDGLALNCLRENHPLKELQSLWPYFREAARLDEETWNGLAGVLDWWLDVWWHYLHRNRYQAVSGLAASRGITAKELVRRTCPIIFVSYDTTPAMIAQFWRDAKEAGLVDEKDDFRLASLYLSMAAEAACGHRWLKTWAGLKRAIRHGCRFRAAGIWFKASLAVYGYFKVHVFGFAPRSGPRGKGER